MAEEIPFSDLIQNLKEVDEVIASAKESLKDFATEFKKTGDYSAEADRSVYAYAMQCKALADEQRKVGKVMSEVKREQDKWKEGVAIERQSYNALVEQSKSLTEAFKEMGHAERSLVVDGKDMATDISRINQQIKRLKDDLKYGTKEIKEFDKGMGSLNKNMTSVTAGGRSLTAATRLMGDAMGKLPPGLQTAARSLYDLTGGFKSLTAAIAPTTVIVLAAQAAIALIASAWHKYTQAAADAKKMQDEVTSSASGNITKLTLLKDSWERLSDTERKSAETTSKFTRELEILGIYAKDAASVNKALTTSFDDLVKSMLNTAYISVYTERLKVLIRREIELTEKQIKLNEAHMDEVDVLEEVNRQSDNKVFIGGKMIKTGVLLGGVESKNAKERKKNDAELNEVLSKKSGILAAIGEYTKKNTELTEGYNKVEEKRSKIKGEKHTDIHTDTTLKQLQDLAVKERDRLKLERDINAEYDVADDGIAKINSKYDKLIASVENEKLLHTDTSKLTKEQLSVYEKDLALSKSITEELEKQREHEIAKLKAAQKKAFVDRTDAKILASIPSPLSDFISAAKEYQSSGKETIKLLKEGTISQSEANKRAYTDMIAFTAKSMESAQKAFSYVVGIYQKELAYKKEVEKEKQKAEETQVSAAQAYMLAQLALAAEGYANDAVNAKNAYEVKTAALEDSNRKIEELNEKEKKANDMLEISDMVVAVAKCFALGPLLGAAAAAAMVASYLVAKKSAQSVASHGEGTLRMIGGGSHASGHDTPVWYENGITHRAERGEYMAVINKRMSERYRNEIPELFNAINTGTYVPIGYRPPGKVDLTPTNGYLARIATAEEGRKTVTFRPDGSREERIGNNVKIYKG